LNWSRKRRPRKVSGWAWRGSCSCCYTNFLMDLSIGLALSSLVAMNVQNLEAGDLVCRPWWWQGGTGSRRSRWLLLLEKLVDRVGWRQARSALVPSRRWGRWWVRAGARGQGWGRRQGGCSVYRVHRAVWDERRRC